MHGQHLCFNTKIMSEQNNPILPAWHFCAADNYFVCKTKDRKAGCFGAMNATPINYPIKLSLAANYVL